MGIPVAAVSRQAVTDAALACEELGHHVEPVSPMIDDRFCSDFGRYACLLAFMVRHAGGRMLGVEFHPERLEPLVKGASGVAVRSAWQLPAALRRLRRLAAEGEEVFNRCDVLLVPSTGHETPPIGHLAPDLDADEHLVRLVRFIAGNPVQNISGSPAVSLPLTRTAAGLPIGVELVAPPGQERRLLELAFELESAAPWPHRPKTAGVETKGKALDADVDEGCG
ncbi:MAG: amidase family protein [Acidobacteriota bacterium]